jgi:hypothetical protein
MGWWLAVWWFGNARLEMLAQRTACSGTDLHCLEQSQQGAAMPHAESLQRCRLLVNFPASQTGICVQCGPKLETSKTRVYQQNHKWVVATAVSTTSANNVDRSMLVHQ